MHAAIKPIQGGEGSTTSRPGFATRLGVPAGTPSAGPTLLRQRRRREHDAREEAAVPFPSLVADSTSQFFLETLDDDELI